MIAPQNIPGMKQSIAKNALKFVNNVRSNVGLWFVYFNQCRFQLLTLSLVGVLTEHFLIKSIHNIRNQCRFLSLVGVLTEHFLISFPGRCPHRTFLSLVGVSSPNILSLDGVLTDHFLIKSIHNIRNQCRFQIAQQAQMIIYFRFQSKCENNLVVCIRWQYFTL
jgi:hypothetical protein